MRSGHATEDYDNKAQSSTDGCHATQCIELPESRGSCGLVHRAEAQVRRPVLQRHRSGDLYYLGQPILAAAGFLTDWSGLHVQGETGSKAGCRQDCLPHTNVRQAHPPAQHLPLIAQLAGRNLYHRQSAVAQQHRQPARILLVGLVPPFHSPLGGLGMRQMRLVPGGLHIIHNPVVTTARLQCDLGVWRQVLQKPPESLPVVSHSLGRPVFAFLVDGGEHRKFLVRVTSGSVLCTGSVLNLRCTSAIQGAPVIYYKVRYGETGQEAYFTGETCATGFSSSRVTT
jgi:hypothetical protein